jgi:hypothetical protein
VSLGDGTGSIRFAWKIEAEAASYNLRIADNPEMARPLANVRVAANYYTHNIATGPLQARPYYWTVSQTGIDGAVSAPTPVRQFTLIDGSAVSPLYPPEGHRVFDDVLSRLRFSWRRIGEGETRFQLSSSPDFSTFITNAAVRGSDFRITTLDPGSYYWRVQVNAGGSPASFSPTRSFVVTRAQVLPVILEYPTERQHISAETATQRPLTLRWSAQDQQVQNARLVLSASPDPFQGTPLMDVQSPEQSLPLIPLRPGTYYWSIRASNGDGRDISAERPASFIVDPAPLFPAPGGRRPINNYHFDAGDLQRIREIIFSWNSVDGANRYILTIYTTDSGQRRQVLRTEPRTALTYTFTDLSRLTGERFVWTVEAVSTTDTGIAQWGIPGENSFVVEIPVPKVVIDDPGRLYGE